VAGEPSISFGNLLKRHRNAAGISQEVLAQRARVSAAAISSLERGMRRAPYRETVKLLADALGLPVAEGLELERVAELARPRGATRISEIETRHNLPLRPTSFVGRTQEIAEIAEAAAEHRLVTVTGPGGVGKSRLVMEIAQRITPANRKIRFVDLAPLAEGAFIAGQISSVVDAPLARRGDSVESLAWALRDRRLLLIFDSCEHLVAEAADAAHELLRACPHIRILATSRERLRITGEFVYRLTPFRILEDAVDLFVDRARLVDSHFALTDERIAIVRDICRRLDGMPLAIELAATHIGTLDLGRLRERLREQFVLSGGARDVPRHESMRATIAWSYNSLSESERTLLRRLGAFTGGFILESVEAVCSGDGITVRDVAPLVSALAEKSLVTVVFDDGFSRYDLLDSVRSFALEMLGRTNEKAAVAREHARWFATFADLSDARSQTTPRSIWLKGILPELENVRAAVDWALADESDESALLAGRIVGGLRLMWLDTGRYDECHALVNAALDRIDESRHPEVVARLLRALFQSTTGDEMFAAAQRAIQLFERIGDTGGLASLQVILAVELCWRGRFADAERSLESAVRSIDKEHMRNSIAFARYLTTRGQVVAYQGKIVEARENIEEAIALASIVGDEHEPLFPMGFLAEIEYIAGHPIRAAEIAEDTLSRTNNRTPPALVEGLLCILARFRLLLGEVDAAESAARRALSLPSLGRARQNTYWSIQTFAGIAAARGRVETAARLTGFVDAWCMREGYRRTFVNAQAYQRLSVTINEELSDRAIVALTAQGASLTLERALDEALAI
jgi:predicted ATPase/DNA-binding XRE family transcriptional regulator